MCTARCKTKRSRKQLHGARWLCYLQSDKVERIAALVVPYSVVQKLKIAFGYAILSLRTITSTCDITEHLRISTHLSICASPLGTRRGASRLASCGSRACRTHHGTKASESATQIGSVRPRRRRSTEHSTRGARQTGPPTTNEASHGVIHTTARRSEPCRPRSTCTVRGTECGPAAMCVFTACASHRGR